MSRSATTTSIPVAEAAIGDVVLSVEGLSVSITGSSLPPLVNDVSFDVRSNQVVALVGESGSGKSTVCYAVMDLLDENLSASSGTVRARRHADADGEPRASFARGRDVGMIFQDSLAALNPVRKVGAQIAEARVLHRLASRKEAKEWAKKTLGRLGFPDPDAAVRAYPHMLSGGMRQRVCVVTAFAADPSVVIADEPTTALDVSSQGKLLQVLREEMQAHDSGLLLISHDIAVVRSMADVVLVMYGGRVLERGPARQVLNNPRSPYTRALLASIPTMDEHAKEVPLAAIAGQPSGPTEQGCPFRDRCANAISRCAETFPSESLDGEHAVWCWNPDAEAAA